MARARRRYTT
ncbi:hypothetical protein E2C01_084589 [Portunus trituberculatus]|uniref:Uncharacterized protein n=1 Tax=Portunus trituberculatus TaxID=210409 RepID=A0A5B7J4F3_PORTR|nr:hypothetical protein [Portunus trituberculatus]